MVILGIDPGTQRMGYGVVRKSGSSVKLLDAGLIAVVGHHGPDVMAQIKSHLNKLIDRFHPELIALERLYFAKNQKTAMSVAEARGVILLAAGERSLPIREYNPNEIKLAITGYGGADKRAVLKMVKIILKKPSLDVIDDASDALAVAIVACGDISEARV